MTAGAWRVEDFEPDAPVRRLAGQLAAFPIDLPETPARPASVPHSAAQLALFDPEVDA